MKIDLHTHSIASPDGGLTLEDYEKSDLDVIAITDHDRVDFALDAREKLGVKIIVGEEITTSDGEIIGLFLREKIEPGLTARETCEKIMDQRGIVYIPHPFETFRSGISLEALDDIADCVDIVETANGRAVFQDRGSQAQAWALANHKTIAASSDAHGRHGWNRTFSQISDEQTAVVTNTNIVQLLRGATLHTRKVGLGIVYPKLNRLKKGFRK